MEIARVGEVLADQFRPDHAVSVSDQAAIGLVRQERLADPGHGERIKQAGQQRQEQQDDDRRTERGFDVVGP